MVNELARYIALTGNLHSDYLRALPNFAAKPVL